MENIILYTINCPKCMVLEKKLQLANIKYSVIKDLNEMESLKITALPVLSVNGKLLEFKDAVDFINSRTK